MAFPPTLVLFARTPALGRIKTRLSPPLSQEDVLALYVAFLEDAAAAYGSSPRWAPVLAAEPDPDDPLLTRLFPPPWRRQAQARGDLGVRLAAALGSELARGAPAALAVGSDHPALSRRLIEQAFEAVSAGCDAAIVPAEDGGYCAIAFSRRVEPERAFRGVPWSSPETCAVTRSQLEAEGYSVRELATAYDVDRPGDLERLRRDLEVRDRAAPDFPAATARALRELGRGGRP